METTLERLRERAQEVVRRAPEVEAVVLFGSRARGTAGPGSDWDVALIEKNGKAPEVAYRLLDALPGVRLLEIGAGEIERHKDTAGALEAALARQGVTLAGAWRRPACRKEALSMDTVRIRAHLANATDQMDKAVRAGIEHLYAISLRAASRGARFAAGGNAPRTPRSPTGSSSAPRCSTASTTRCATLSRWDSFHGALTNAGIG